MKHSFKEQILAVHYCRSYLKKDGNDLYDSELNDASSSLAALNLNPDIFDRVKELERALDIYRKADRESVLPVSILTYPQQQYVNNLLT